MPPEDPLNACLLAIRTLEVELKNSIACMGRHDRDITEIKEDVGEMNRDIAILRNDLDGFVRIRNYLIAACLAQLAALFFAIPALIVQVQHLSTQNITQTTKITK